VNIGFANVKKACGRLTERSMLELAFARVTAALQRLLPWAGAAIAVPIFALDLINSPKIAVGAMYLAAVLVSGFFCQMRGVVLTALWCACLILVASYFDPENPINTAIRLSAIGLGTFLVAKAQSAEDELLEAKDRFRVLAESSLTGVYLVRDGVFQYVNPALARMFGYNADELVGRAGPIDLAYPPDRALVVENIRRRVDGATEEIRYELRGVRKDGSIFPIEVHGRRVELAGNVGIMGTLLDNTERQRALEELRASEARSLEMQRLAHVGWWERDFSTKRVSLSDEVCRIFGIDPVDLPDWHDRWLGLIHPEDRQRAAEASAAAIRGERRYDVEYRVVRADGSIRVIHSQGDVVWDDEGHPLRQFGVLQDVTDLWQADRELRASEARFRTFVDHAADAFFLHGDDLAIVDVNRQACLSLGYSRQELIGMHPRSFDVGLDEASIQTLANRVAAGETVTFETVHRRKDGTTFPVEVRAGRFEQNGEFRRLTLVRDITERKQAEETLRRSEAYMAAAESLTKSGSWAWKPGANEITHWSKGRYALFGFDPAAGVPSLEAVLERIHPEDRAPWLESMTRVAHGGETDFDFRIVLPDGETKHVHAVGRPILNKSGAVVEIIGAAVDITEQKQAQEALRASEEQWKAVFENNPTMYFMLDSSHTILSVNPFGAEQLGYEREDLIGRHVGTIIHEDDLEYALKNKKDCLERLGRSNSWEVRKIRKDGGVIYARETGRAMSVQARPVVLIASEDITEAKRAAEALREAQAQVRRLVDANIIGIETWHFDGRVLAANDAYLQILGYSREDLVSGLLRWPDLTPPEWRDISFARFEEVKRTGTARPHEKEYFRKDGSRVPVLVGATLLDEERGVSFVLDLTERRRAEEALREAQMQLAHANRLETLGQLTAMIAHEVTQPIAATLTNAKAGLRFLRFDPPDLDEVSQALERIVRDGERAGAVVQRVRNLVKRASPGDDRFDINAAIRDVIEFFRNEATKNSVSVKTKLAEGLPPPRGNRVEVQQVILNLILNAIEAMSGMSDEPRELEITTGQTEAGQILVAVRDSGPGLAPAIQEHLFKAFHTTKPNGLGLGLSICRSIIENHGGRLSATANAPRGVVFQFTLPRATRADPADDHGGGTG